MAQIVVETDLALVSSLDASPGTNTEEARWGSEKGRGHWETARKSSFRRDPQVALGTVQMALKEAGDLGAFTPAGTPLSRNPGSFPEAPNGVLGACIKSSLGLVGNGPFWGLLGVGPWRGCFLATEYVPLIPGGYLDRDFRLFKAEVCPSDSKSQNWVVPRNFTAGSGSNGCNNFPWVGRPPLHPPWLSLKTATISRESIAL